MKNWAIIIFIFLLPYVAEARIRINEIVWMGISSDPNKESFEIYNPTNQSVDLNGWIIYRKDKNTLLEKSILSLEGIILPGEYFVVNRITGNEKQFFQDKILGRKFHGGALANTGEYLILKNRENEIIWELNNLNGWIAGDNNSKYTMQYTGSSWITAPATLGYQNSLDTKKEELKKDDQQKSIKETENYLEIKSSRNLYKNINYIFSAEGFFDKKLKGNFIWNMGDGTYIENKNLLSINHIYKNSGTYNVVLAFVDRKGDLVTKDSLEVLVRDLDIDLIKHSDEELKIINKGNILVDLSTFKILNNQNFLNIPKFTEILPGAEIIISLDDKISNKIDVYTETGIYIFSKDFSQMKNDNTSVLSSSTQKINLDKKIQTINIDNENNINPKQNLILDEKDNKKENSHTSKFFIGVTIFLVIALFLLLERFMTQKE